MSGECRGEQGYLDLLRFILEQGRPREDRTGTGTLSHFGAQLRFDLREHFPLLTTKKVHLKAVIHELLWFLRGDTHVAYLQEHGVRIWNEWATKEKCAEFGRPEGELGPIYGHQWRNFGATRNADGSYDRDGVDQIAQLVAQIQARPASRRLIVSGWNPQEADRVHLPPCHTLFQFHVDAATRALDCQLYQRSADMFLGVPFNIASYALLTCMIAHVTGLKPRTFIHTFGDAHIYNDHVEQVKLQLSREVRPPPKLRIKRGVPDIFSFQHEDFEIIDYHPHPAIKAAVSV